MAKKRAADRVDFAIRKTAVMVEEIRLEAGRADGPPLVRVTAMAAIAQPICGHAADEHRAAYRIRLRARDAAGAEVARPI
jgi:hypothetical protein